MESLNILVCWVMCYASVSDTDDFLSNLCLLQACISSRLISLRIASDACSMVCL